MTSTLSTYLYAIVPADTSLPLGLTGLGEQPVGAVAHGDLAAVVGPVESERPLGRRADLVAHGQVLDALVQRGPVIPVRFGTVFDDDAQVVESVLAPQSGELMEVIEGLRGRSQFTLRARYDERIVLSEVLEENTEIALLRKATRGRPDEATYHDRVRLGELVAQALERKREADGQAVLDALAPIAAASTVLPGAGIDHLIDVAFLVDDEVTPAFEEAAESVAAAVAPRARLSLVGPVAPHDFVPRDE